MTTNLGLLLHNLQTKQEKIDDFIFDRHYLNRQNTFTQRVVSFIIELSEFYNEERSFKYWSKKPSSKKAILLDEFADGLHFLLSLSIDVNFNFQKNLQLKTITDELNKNIFLSDLYMQLIQNVNVFFKTPNHLSFVTLFRNFWHIAVIMQFSSKEIKTAYLLKYKTNVQRQDSNY